MKPCRVARMSDTRVKHVSCIFKKLSHVVSLSVKKKGGRQNTSDTNIITKTKTQLS